MVYVAWNAAQMHLIARDIGLRRGLVDSFGARVRSMERHSQSRAEQHKEANIHFFGFTLNNLSGRMDGVALIGSRAR
jgi:hypothetical protein